MARRLASSDVIARAKFVSLDSATKKHADYGYVVELMYRFEAVQNLNGNGPDEVGIRMNSGPKQMAFPDAIATAPTVEEAACSPFSTH